MGRLFSLIASASATANASAIEVAIALALIIAPAPVASQTPAPAPGPRAVIAKTTHDFGVVGLGTEPTAEIPVRNTGTAPLEISVSSPPRGLRVVHLDRTIAPKAAGAVRLAVDTFHAGPTNDWRVEIRTSDPAHARVEVTLGARVQAFLALEPYSARFSFVQYGKEGGTAHILAATDATPLVVTSVESPFDYIRATFREAKGDERIAEAAGRQWRIALTIAELAPVGPIGGYVIVHTNHPKQPRAFLPVTGFVRPLFAVTPPSVDLREVKVSAADGAPPLRTLVVKNFGADPLALKGLSSDLAWLDGTIVEVEAGHVWRVELRPRPVPGAGSAMPGGAAAGPFKGTLRLATNSTRVPEIAVAIQGTLVVDPAP